MVHRDIKLNIMIAVRNASSGKGTNRRFQQLNIKKPPLGGYKDGDEALFEISFRRISTDYNINRDFPGEVDIK
jgi:hypothetical protein